MRRHLWIWTLAALFGGSLLASDASACCHKRKCATYACTPTCAPAPAPEPAPAPAPAPEPVACKPKKCGLFGGHKLFGCCHKKAAVVCEVAPACPAPIPCAPCGYAAPYAAPVASYQSPAPLPSYQAPVAVPTKQGY